VKVAPNHFVFMIGFVSGHGFSHASSGEKKWGFSPCAFYFEMLGKGTTSASKPALSKRMRAEGCR
jgi:hypothetical protein